MLSIKSLIILLFLVLLLLLLLLLLCLSWIACNQAQWPTKSACPQCRLPTLEKRSDERGGSDGGRRTGEAQAAQTDEVQVTLVCTFCTLLFRA
jgi:hypothetical protein